MLSTNDIFYKHKYLKYKNKYLNLKAALTNKTALTNIPVKFGGRYNQNLPKGTLFFYVKLNYKEIRERLKVLLDIVNKEKPHITFEGLQTLFHFNGLYYDTSLSKNKNKVFNIVKKYAPNVIPTTPPYNKICTKISLNFDNFRPTPIYAQAPSRGPIDLYKLSLLFKGSMFSSSEMYVFIMVPLWFTNPKQYIIYDCIRIPFSGMLEFPLDERTMKRKNYYKEVDDEDDEEKNEEENEEDTYENKE